MTFDLVVIGRTGVDLYPLQHGVPLESVTTFQKYLGGSASNVAVAAARHGLDTALVTRTGADPFGRFIRNELERLGVNVSFVDTVPDLNTPVAFCEIFPPDNFPLYFYRQPTAPDLQIQASELDLTAIMNAKIFWATGTGLSEDPSRTAHFEAWAARGRKPLTVLDLDYRASAWPDENEARVWMQRALDHVTVAVGNLAECEIAVGEVDPYRAADALLDRGLDLAVVKKGPEGVLARTRNTTVDIPPYLVEVVNGLGAGDGFGGALCHGLIQGWPLDRVIRFANIAGAIVASRLECSTAMPTTDEVETIYQSVDGNTFMEEEL